MFDWHANSAREQIKAQEHTILVRQPAVEILKDYDFKADKATGSYCYFTQPSGDASVFGFGG